MKNKHFFVFAIVLLLFWIPLLTSFVVGLVRPINFDFYGANEWLINYSAGFVRRGLGGEIVSFLSSILNVEFYLIIKAISIVSFVGYIFCLFFCFKRKSISLLLVVCPVFCLCLFLYPELSFYRKDALMMCLAFASFWFYIGYIHTDRILFSIFFVLVTSIGLLLHEAYFFYVVPACIFIGICISRARKHFSMMDFSIFVTVFAVFILCLIAKGNTEMAQTIWTSWNDEFVGSYYQKWLTSSPRGSIGAIGGQTSVYLQKHIELNFLDKSGILNIQNVYLFLFMMFLFYYLIVFNNLLSFKKNIFSDKKRIATILFIQIVSMSPFFILLSCDYGRLVFYCFSTTIFLYALIDTQIQKEILVGLPNNVKKLLFVTISHIIAFYEKVGGQSYKFYIVAYLIVSFPMVSRPGSYLNAIVHQSLAGSILKLLASFFRAAS